MVQIIRAVSECIYYIQELIEIGRLLLQVKKAELCHFQTYSLRPIVPYLPYLPLFPSNKFVENLTLFLR